MTQKANCLCDLVACTNVTLSTPSSIVGSTVDKICTALLLHLMFGFFFQLHIFFLLTNSVIVVMIVYLYTYCFNQFIFSRVNS